MNLFNQMKVVESDLPKAMLFFTNSDVPSRLAYYLKLAFEASGHNMKDVAIIIPQDEIAAQIGASRSFVSTLINEWKREGVLSSQGRQLTVLSTSKLEAKLKDKNAEHICKRYYKMIEARANRQEEAKKLKAAKEFKTAKPA